MNSDIERLYQQTILDYNNRKDIKREIDKPTYIERGHNPSCGDDITLFLKIKDDKIEDASFLGTSCAISTASTAMLMEDVKGKTIDEAKDIVDEFFKMMREEKEADVDKLKDAVLMEYVANMPARIKCATLSWHSMNVILDKELNK